ncbi:MAG: dockerin type I repeat-containing protein, partial [Candidatus Zixiibacteriota bacterium]
MRILITTAIVLILCVPALSTAADNATSPLARMTQRERENTEIALMLEETGDASEQARCLTDCFEALWNGGDYEQALSVYDRLVELVGAEKIDVLIHLRVPVVTSSPRTAAGDILFCNYADVYDVELCAHSNPDILFAPVLTASGAYPSTLIMYHSADGGQTWSSAHSTGTSGWYEQISAIVIDDYCYVAINWISSGRVILMRYRASDGDRVNFPVAGAYLTVALETFEEIVLAHTDGFSDMYLLGNKSNGDLHFYEGWGADYETWTEYGTGVNDVDRGLDAVGTWGVVTNYNVYVSYINDANRIKIRGRTSYGDWSERFDYYSDGSGNIQTSIDAKSFDNKIVCVFERVVPGVNNRTSSVTWGSAWSGDFGNMSDIENRGDGEVYAPVVDLNTDGDVIICFMKLIPGPMTATVDLHKIISFNSLGSLYSTDPESFAERPVWVPTTPDVDYLGDEAFGVVYAAKNDDYKGYFARLAGYACGDANGDGDVNLLDILYLIDFLYGNPTGPAPDPMESGDANADGDVNLLDILYLIDYLYGSP